MWCFVLGENMALDRGINKFDAVKRRSRLGILSNWITGAEGRGGRPVGRPVWCCVVLCG